MNIDNIKLISGVGDREANELCVMSLTALIAGEPHTDKPVCACPVLTAAAIRLNDGLWWASDEERTAALKPLSAELIGTRSTAAVELRRAGVFVDLALRVWAPKAFDCAAFLHPDEPHREALAACAASLRELDESADPAAAADTVYAARSAASAAVYASSDAARAAANTAHAASVAADSAAAASPADAADAAARVAHTAAYAADADTVAIRGELLAAIRSAIKIVD